MRELRALAEGRPLKSLGPHRAPGRRPHCWAFGFAWHLEEQLVQQRAQSRANLVPGTWRPVANKENDYLIDREKQRTQNFTGIDQRIHAAEDRAVTEGMGPIYERTREHLGASDTAIIAARERLLSAVRGLEQGIDPPGTDPATHRIRAAAILLPNDVPFAEGAAEGLKAQPGVGLSTV